MMPTRRDYSVNDIAYEIMWLDAIEADYKGGKVFSVPAPASGAMFISALGLLSTFDHEGEGSAIDLHRTTEAMKVRSLLFIVISH